MKSDDVVGRTRMYESIVKGDYQLESGLPESFNVLMKELQALALDVQLVEEDKVPKDVQSPMGSGGFGAQSSSSTGGIGGGGSVPPTTH